MPATLPQKDPNRAARAGALEDSRHVWQYGDWYGLQTFAKRTPAREFPTFTWLLRALPVALVVQVNTLLFRIFGPKLHLDRRRAKDHPARDLDGVPSSPSSQARHGRLSRLQRAVKTRSTRLVDGLIGETLGAKALPDGPASPAAGVAWKRRGRVAAVADFNRVYQVVPTPAETVTREDYILTDKVFAWLRVAGSNPEVLQRADAVPDWFPADLTTKDGVPCADLAIDGRLFVADFGMLDVLQPSTWRGLLRTVGVPKALFAVADDGGLAPVAIAFRAHDVIRPGDPEWNLAKLAVEVANANHHEMVSHLGRTHLLVEVFAMATRRNLAPSHPVLRLLAPHFEGTIFMNDSARHSLVSDGGAVDHLFAGTIASSRALTVWSLSSLDLARYDLPARTRARGTEKIADYPWRDDALPVWDAIEAFVAEYVAHYYATPEDLAGDDELAAWSATLAQPVGKGGLAGFEAPKNAAELTRVLTLVIYTASAGHAAVNFTQYPWMSYAPLTSGAGWSPLPTKGQPADLNDLAEFLPPRRLAVLMTNVLYLLSSVQDNWLGHYPADWWDDAAVDAMVGRLRERLAALETAIKARNTKRLYPYLYLLPSRIPRSIHI